MNEAEHQSPVMRGGDLGQGGMHISLSPLYEHLFINNVCMPLSGLIFYLTIYNMYMKLFLWLGPLF